MIDLPRIGIALKRMVLHDPYAPVRPYDLLKAGAAGLVLFYVGILSLIWALARDKEARPVLFNLLAGSALCVFFSVLLSYPGQQERYMPFYVGLLPATAWVFRGWKAFPWRAIPFALLIVTVWITDFTSYASAAEPGAENAAVARLLALKPVFRPHSIVALVSGTDELYVFQGRFPFHPLSLMVMGKVYRVTEATSPDSPRWRQAFAQLAWQTWREDGDVWISRRLLAETPQPDWGWAEGDDPYLTWRDIPPFFRAFVFDSEVGGTDGFARIARIPGNQALLDSTLAAPVRSR